MERKTISYDWYFFPTWSILLSETVEEFMVSGLDICGINHPVSCLLQASNENLRLVFEAFVIFVSVFYK